MVVLSILTNDIGVIAQKTEIYGIIGTGIVSQTTIDIIE
jgi:hypothetical protein